MLRRIIRTLALPFLYRKQRRLTEEWVDFRRAASHPANRFREFCRAHARERKARRTLTDFEKRWNLPTIPTNKRHAGK